jgi:hypothetical protein
MNMKLAGYDFWRMVENLHISSVSVHYLQHARQHVARAGRKARVAENQVQVGNAQTYANLRSQLNHFVRTLSVSGRFPDFRRILAYRAAVLSDKPRAPMSCPSQPLSHFADHSNISSTAHARATTLLVWSNRSLPSVSIPTWKMHVALFQNSPHDLVLLRASHSTTYPGKEMVHGVRPFISMIILCFRSLLSRPGCKVNFDSSLQYTSFHDTSTFVCIAAHRLRR